MFLTIVSHFFSYCQFVGGILPIVFSGFTVIFMSMLTAELNIGQIR